MDPDHCPKCDAKTVLAGRVQQSTWYNWFEPTGMRFFSFRISGRGVRCSKPFLACLTCGHVWTDLQPADLLTFIDKYGSAKTKLKLSPFRKAPPEKDLV
jgi:hypothetical protein